MKKCSYFVTGLEPDNVFGILSCLSIILNLVCIGSYAVIEAFVFYIIVNKLE